MILARLGRFAGLAVAVIPCAIFVHLGAEAAAVGRERVDVAFLARHTYLAVLFVGALAWFAATAGCGRGASERRRRCALMRADLDGSRGWAGMLALAGGNLAFFALTQTLEGVPIATGAFVLSLIVAVAGSFVAARLALFFGHALLTATLAAVIGSMKRKPADHRAGLRVRVARQPRHATAPYSLLRPNRPPPFPSCI